MTEFVLNITGYVDITGLVPIVTGFVINMTGFVLKIT